MNSTAPLSVVIAVLTYQRPEDIALALPRLLQQANSVTPPASVLVIDNDPAGSARPTVEAFATPQLRYVNEVTPGISAARNRALAESADQDLLIFIDDDEVPVEAWLASLLRQYRYSTPAAVAGPVISDYAQEPEPWVAAGEFFTRRRLPSGSPLTVAATNNLLLDLHQIRALGLTFDERFGLSGGSDTLFTRQLLRAGAAMVWCDEAVVIDMVPANRLTRDWVLRRALRSGNSWSRVMLELSEDSRERTRHRLTLSARGGLRLVGGGGRFLVGVATRNPRHQAKGLRSSARGAGMLSGAFGYVYSEYKRKAQ